MTDVEITAAIVCYCISAAIVYGAVVELRKPADYELIAVGVFCFFWPVVIALGILGIPVWLFVQIGRMIVRPFVGS
jgi:hypothetical protein